MRSSRRHRPPLPRTTMVRLSPTSRRRAKRNNWRMAFTVVGPAGELIYFEKMDGTQLASTEISQGKARTAVMFRRASKAFADQYAAGNTSFLTFPEKPVASEGGIPITVNGKVIGAIGASGGTGQQDGMAATAGAAAAKEPT